MRISARQARLLEQRTGQPLDWVDVTQFGDAEPMVVLTTPRCDYCGTPNPTGECGACGASVLRDGPVQEQPRRRLPNTGPKFDMVKR